MVTVALGIHNKNEYIVHTLTCIYSVLCNTNQPLAIVLMHDATLHACHKELVTRLCDRFSAGIRFCDVTEYTRGLAISNEEHFSVGTLFRVLLPTVVGKGKVVYLDSDICCNLDIASLWAVGQEKSTFALCGVHDEAVCMERFTQYVLSKGLDPQSYFNCGVLLLNVDRINALWPDFTASLLRMSADKELNFPDQDALNMFFAREGAASEVCMLDEKYNFNLSFLQRHMLAPEHLEHRIVHYGFHKPWEKTFPAALVYWRYREGLFQLLQAQG